MTLTWLPINQGTQKVTKTIEGNTTVRSCSFFRPEDFMLVIKSMIKSSQSKENLKTFLVRYKILVIWVDYTDCNEYLFTTFHSQQTKGFKTKLSF